MAFREAGGAFTVIGHELMKGRLHAVPNVLVGTDPACITAEARKILYGEDKQGRRPHLWNGKAAERIVEILVRELS